jgi:hypothetical protein
MKQRITWNIVKHNRYGHRWIEEPSERVAFREKCKYIKMGCACEKGYSCIEQFEKKKGILAELFGCTPNVDCPRLRRWDKKNGLEQPYTMVANKSS